MMDQLKIQLPSEIFGDIAHSHDFQQEIIRGQFLNGQFMRKTAVLGEGTFGNVSKILLLPKEKELKDTTQHEPVYLALKQIHHSERESFLNELSTLRRFSGKPCILRLFGFIDFSVKDQKQPSNFVLFLEYHPLSLFKYRLFTKDLSYPLIVSYLCQMLIGLKQLHTEEFHHGDVKPENMLINRKGDLFLSDFGTCSNQVPNERKSTIHYTSPEILLTEAKSRKKEMMFSNDIWAVGCSVLHFIFIHLNCQCSSQQRQLGCNCCRYPFYDSTEIGIIMSHLQMFGTPTTEEAKKMNWTLFSPNFPSWVASSASLPNESLRSRPSKFRCYLDRSPFLRDPKHAELKRVLCSIFILDWTQRPDVDVLLKDSIFTPYKQLIPNYPKSL